MSKSGISGRAPWFEGWGNCPWRGQKFDLATRIPRYNVDWAFSPQANVFLSLLKDSLLDFLKEWSDACIRLDDWQSIWSINIDKTINDDVSKRKLLFCESMLWNHEYSTGNLNIILSFLCLSWCRLFIIGNIGLLMPAIIIKTMKWVKFSLFTLLFSPFSFLKNYLL